MGFARHLRMEFSKDRGGGERLRGYWGVATGSSIDGRHVADKLKSEPYSVKLCPTLADTFA